LKLVAALTSLCDVVRRQFAVERTSSLCVDLLQDLNRLLPLSRVQRGCDGLQVRARLDVVVARGVELLQRNEVVTPLLFQTHDIAGEGVSRQINCLCVRVSAHKHVHGALVVTQRSKEVCQCVYVCMCVCECVCA
jgi:hypothetical protein